MKIIKYIIFFSVLGGIFLIVYRNSDSKGLRRWWASLKMATSIAAILAGLIPSPVEAIEPHVSNDSPPMERIVKLSGGDQSKFGPGARAKAAARRNAQSSGSFLIPGANGFVPSRNYKASQKPLSCRKNVKINEEQFNGNQNPAKQTSQDCTLTREQRRNLPHLDDVIIPDQDVIIRHGQAKYKVKNHGSDFSLPSKPNEKGWLKTPRTSENIEGFKDEIKKLVLRSERIEGTYRKGEPDQFSAIHFYDSAIGCIAIFKQETKEFVSAWKLTQGQVNDLLTNKNIGDY